MKECKFCGGEGEECWRTIRCPICNGSGAVPDHWTWDTEKFEYIKENVDNGKEKKQPTKK